MTRAKKMMNEKQQEQEQKQQQEKEQQQGEEEQEEQQQDEEQEQPGEQERDELNTEFEAGMEFPFEEELFDKGRNPKTRRTREEKTKSTEGRDITTTVSLKAEQEKDPRF